MQGRIFKLAGDIEERIVLDTEFAQDFMRRVLHDLRARIVILVDAMAKTHETGVLVPVLDPIDEGSDLARVANLGEHLERRFVGAAMGGPPEAGNSCGNAGERIGAG